MMSIIGQCKLTISTRYHFCLFSAVQGTPFLPLKRSDKLIDLSEDLAWPHGCTIRELDSDLLTKQAGQLLDSPAGALEPPAGFQEAARGHWDAAEQFMQQALEIEPENAEFWFNLGYVFQQQNKDADAIRCFERTVALRRGLDRAWFGLGLIHRRRGDTPQAVQAFKMAAELQPMNPHAFYELAMAQLALNNLQEVHRIIRQVSGFDPEMTRRLIRETGQRPEGVHLQ